jgi:hypothetical protein
MEDNQFFREVDEEYRRDRVAQIWKRYNGLIVGLAVLLVIGVGGWRYWQYVERSRAEAAALRFEEATRLARDGKATDAEKSLEALIKDAPRGYQLIARFRLAAETGKNSAEAGAQAYDALAADTSIDPVFRDLARLRAAMPRIDGDNAAAVQTSLQGLATPTNAWRHSARELLGLQSLKRGDFDAASRWFDQIAADRETPAGLRQRLEIYAALVAGGPVQVTQ